MDGEIVPMGYERCGARSRSGAPCAKPAGWGTDHVGVGRCRLHGGATPTHALRAAAQLEERRALSILQRLERPRPIDHPVVELFNLAAETAEMKDIFRERLSELQTLETIDSLGTERERAVVLLYERSLDRLAKILTDMARLDLEARSRRIRQDDARAVMECVVEALRRSGLGEHERIVRQHLRDTLAERTA